MSPVLRPIRGFGPWGWALLPVAAALAYCTLGGFDLRHAIIEACYHRYGGQFVSEVLIHRLLFGSYLASMTGVVAGPITLLAVLIAMHLSPRRWAWWQWAVVSAWLILNPWLCLEIAKMLPPFAARWLGWMPVPGVRRVVTAGEVHGVVIAQLVLLAALAAAIHRPLARSEHRSRWRWAALGLLGFGVLLGTFQWWADWPSTQSSMPLSRGVWLAMGAAWHCTAAALLIGGAIAARRRVLGELWRCARCGYDLRGHDRGKEAAGVCSECGSANPRLTSSPSPPPASPPPPANPSPTGPATCPTLPAR